MIQRTAVWANRLVGNTLVVHNMIGPVSVEETQSIDQGRGFQASVEEPLLQKQRTRSVKTVYADIDLPTHAQWIQATPKTSESITHGNSTIQRLDRRVRSHFSHSASKSIAAKTNPSIARGYSRVLPRAAAKRLRGALVHSPVTLLKASIPYVADTLCRMEYIEELIKGSETGVDSEALRKL